MITALRRFWRLSTAERWRCVRALAALARTDVELRTIGYLRSVRRAERSSAMTHAPTASEMRWVGQMARSVRAASAVYPLHAECLHRAVTLHRLLRRAGLDGAVRIGVRRVEGALTAHAWVELGGEVVSDPVGSVSGFVRLTPAGGDVWDPSPASKVATN